MKIYAIGDLHLSFSSDKPMDIYGPEWANHTERLQANWEHKISDEDIALIVGDISWALKLNDAKIDLNWIHNLPGKKIMIRGNHDLWWSSINKLNNLYDDMIFLQNTHFEVGNTAICGSRGWTDLNDPDFTENDEKIYRRELLRMEMSLSSAEQAGIKDIIAAIHFPPAASNNKSTPFTDLFEKYNVRQVVYGHLHGIDSYDKGITGNLNGIDYSLVSIDYLNCDPLEIR